MQSEDFNKYYTTNKETWNKKVSVHYDSKFYDVRGFLSGKSSLNSIELSELGDVNMKSILHLQCHFGLDTLSLARLGASCTGVDISNSAIKRAQELNLKANLNAKFVESNIYDIPEKINKLYDIVFTSYGVIGWLHNLDLWAKIIANRLKPKGVFYMVEFHPIVWMFDYLNEKPIMQYHYLNKKVIYEEYEGTYGDKNSKMISKEYGWNHGLGEVITALTKAGLQIEFLHEFEESPYDNFPNMVKNKNGMYQLKEENNYYPLLYSVKAVKK